MKLNCKPGELAFIVKDGPGCERNIGLVVRVLDDDLAEDDEWRCSCEYAHVLAESAISGEINAGELGQEFWIPDAYLKPLRGDVGNESWFTAAPKSLPATTKGDTITERGELA